MDAPVIVVGGGPVGLSLALGLATYGVRSIVLEKNEQPETQSRALAVWARTLEHLSDWGARDALLAAGIASGAFTVADASDGCALLSVDFGVLDDVLACAQGVVVPQYETERVLREALLASGMCEVQPGCEVVGLHQDDRGVTLQARTGTGVRSLRAAYVAGCDGAHGFVRHAVGLTLQGLTYRARAVLSDDAVDFDDGSAGLTIRLAVDEPGLLFGIRFAPKTWRIIAFVPRGMDDDTALSPAVHAARHRALFGPDATARTSWKSIFQLHRRRAAHFVVGRVALAGDAAHLVSPAGGEGMNAGIQDAGNLAWKLAFAIRGLGDASLLLQSYEAERPQMIADTVDRKTDRLTHAAMNVPVWMRRLLFGIVRRTLRSRGMRAKAARAFGMLDGRYAKSPLVDSRHPLAGRRIDDLAAADGSRIDKRRNGGPAIVYVGNVGADGFDAIRLRGAPKRWCVKPPAAVIVRPDGVVAAVVEKPTRAKIESAWSRAFAGASYDSMRSSIDTL